MPSYMLDTDTVSYALRGIGGVAQRILQHRPSEIVISSITLAELRHGADRKKSRKLHGLIDTFIAVTGVAAFDSGCIRRSGGCFVRARRTYRRTRYSHRRTRGGASRDACDKQHQAFFARRGPHHGQLGVSRCRRCSPAQSSITQSSIRFSSSPAPSSSTPRSSSAPARAASGRFRACP
jgi:predicted nucleic acid-binding protein